MWEKILSMYFRFKAKRKLLKQYRYVQEVDKMLEQYLTDTILKGGSADFLAKMRTDLIAKQGGLKTQEAFIEYLKNVKVI